MRDETAEQVMRQAGVEAPTPVSVPIGCIRRDVSKAAYQTRMISDKLNPDAVESYASAMRRGSQFPPVVLNRNADRQTYDILGGFHRINAAALAGLKVFDAYVLSIPPNEADQLARTLNSVISLPGMGRNERVAHAIYLVEKHDYTHAAAAAAQNIPVSTLEMEMRARRVYDRMRGKVDMSGLPTSLVASLHRVHNDNVLVALVKIIGPARIGDTVIRPVLADLVRKHSEADQLAVVSEFANTDLVREKLARIQAGRTGGTRSYRKVSILLRNINAAIHVLKTNNTPAKLGLTDKDWDELVTRKIELDEIFEDVVESAEPKVLRHA
jgi:hypothetical protein